MTKIKIGDVLIEVVADRKDIPSRTDRAGTIGTTGPSSVLWQTQPTLKAAGENLVLLGDKLDTAQGNVLLLESQLAAARGVRDSTLQEFDIGYGLYVANVRTFAKTPAEVASLGLSTRAMNRYPLVTPLGLEASYDAVTMLLHIHVQRTPGITTFAVEISPNPIAPGSWVRLEGTAAVRDLGGYPPGIHWVRAASVRSLEISDFTAPVAVTVK